MVDKPKKWIPMKHLTNGDIRCEGYNQAIDDYESWLKEKCEEGLENVLLKWSEDIGFPTILYDKGHKLHPHVKHGFIKEIRKHLEVDND